MYLAIIALLHIFEGVPKVQSSYQFNKFTGPVSGIVKEVLVPGAPNHGPFFGHQGSRPSVDYTAMPDYTFAYGVEDPDTGNNQLHEESRDGDVVQGQYSFMEADGSTRVVTYSADPVNGFQASVHWEPSSGGISPSEMYNYPHFTEDRPVLNYQQRQAPDVEQRPSLNVEKQEALLKNSQHSERLQTKHKYKEQPSPVVNVVKNVIRQEVVVPNRLHRAVKYVAKRQPSGRITRILRHSRPGKPLRSQLMPSSYRAAPST